ncbi:MAG: hypothetical protein HDT28_05460 [Clostridiales bacterium]|nr:hypothetical protein [Clostridiales bacterium]
MKKSTKALIAATAAISLVCIGTVSYAAWNNSTASSVDVVGGSTGVISSLGGVTATPSSASGTFVNNKYTMNKLIPIDHNGTVSGAVKYWEFTLTCATTGEQQFNYIVSGELKTTVSGGSNANDIGLYWSTDTPTPTTGTKFETTAAKIIPESDGTKVVYVFLKSNTVDAMGASITLTFNAVDATPSN